MKQYTVGQSIQLSATFKDAAGALFDPVAVKAWVRLPDQSVVDLSADIDRQGQGVYFLIFTPTMNGLHAYRFEGDGETDSSNESNFFAQTVFPELETP